MTLILIDQSIVGYQQLVAAAREDVTVVLFDRHIDTYATLLEKLPTTQHGLVGIVQHGRSPMIEYRLLDKEAGAPVSGVETSDPDLASWTGVRGFFQAVKERVGLATLDLISCRLYAEPGMVYAIQKLETQLGVDLRASADDTGNLAAGGNWIQESDRVDIRDLYFTAAINGYTQLLYPIFYKRSSQMARPNPNLSTMQYSTVGLSQPMISATIPVDPTTFVRASSTKNTLNAWGDTTFAGSLPTELSDIKITALVSNGGAYAALDANGAIKVWGDSTNGGSPVDISKNVWGDIKYYTGAPTGSGFKAIASTSRAFAALDAAGAIKAWGDSTNGGSNTDVSITMWGNITEYKGAPTGTGFTAIASTYNAFAALDATGAIKVWGDPYFGGSTVNVERYDTTYTGAPTGSGFTAIASTGSAFAALDATGAIKVWGDPYFGGSTVNVERYDTTHTGAPTGSGFTAIASTSTAFAALDASGAIKVWGNPCAGGSPADIEINYITYIGAPTGSGFKVIASNGNAFAALDASGAIKVWGDPRYGGSPDDIVFNDITYIGAPTGSGFTAIASTSTAFAALDATGAIKVWGNPSSGGSPDDIDTFGIVYKGAPTGSGFTAIASTSGAFAALDAIGAIKVWGSAQFGGSMIDIDNFGTIYKGAPIGTDFTTIVSNGYTFVALKTVADIIATVPCIPAGQRVLTPTGYRPVESLRQGDLIKTADGRAVPVCIYRTHIESTTAATAPIRIGALRLSPTHFFKVNKHGWLTPAMAADHGLHGAVREASGAPVTYYHLETPNYLQDDLVVEGVTVESFGANFVRANKIDPTKLYTLSKIGPWFIRMTSVKSCARTH